MLASFDPPLLRTFPGLRAHLPRFSALEGTTPVTPFALAGARGASLFVKRDERSCALYGGNKPRKLEFELGRALARGARRLVTTGGLGTHHGLATAVLGRAAGLATTLVLVRQPITDAVRRTLLLHAAWGAQLVWGGNVPGAALQVLRVIAASALRGERPYLVATGGSSRVGDAGFVSAALELAEQVRAGSSPEPEEIYVAVGTGGTLVGLAAGLGLAQLKSRIVGVLVTDILPPSQRSLARQAGRLLAWLRRLDPSLPRARPAPIELALGQRGPGYGAPTPAALDAVAQAAAAGLELETTYTGKCVAEILARARSGALPRGPALFWNTYNAVDVAAHSPRPLDPAALPPRFRHLLDAARFTKTAGGDR